MRARPRWEPAETVDPVALRRLQEELGLHEITARLLLHRGLGDPEEARQFLSPTLRDLPSPSRMRGLSTACRRLEQALWQKERIVIYGDYDVDGVTSTTILYRFLRELGFPPERLHFFIPNRLRDGYGLNRDCLPQVAELGCDLLVTVDCGISSIEEVEEARRLEMETIIIDHHTPPESLPDAVAVLNPHQRDCDYPDKRLAAVGVTFNLLIGLRSYLRQQGFFQHREEPDLRRYLDLVALGTIADVVPILGVNRTLVYHGLHRMAQTPWPGLVALMQSSETEPSRVNTGMVAFRLAPRLNAAGRLREASLGVKLLLSEDPQEAAAISQELEEENRRRRSIEKEIFEEAVQMLRDDPSRAQQKVIVLAREGWHLGVIGIVASRVVERFHRPAILLCVEEGVGRGSGRSLGNFNLYNSLEACQEYLLRFGGHKAAAGLTIEASKIDSFRQAIVHYAQQNLTPEDLQPRLQFDAEFPPERITPSLLDELLLLEPHGVGNPRPLFVCGDARIVKLQRVGADQQHLKLSLAANGSRPMDAIAFSMADRASPQLQRISCVYHPEYNYWKNSCTIQLHIKELHDLASSSEGGPR